MPSNPKRMLASRASGAPGLIVVANRAPLMPAGGGRRWRRSDGGLVSAVAPVMARAGKCWIAACPQSDGPSEVLEPPRTGGYRVRLLSIPDARYRAYYEQMANRILWPLFHGLPPAARFEHAHWESYRLVNEQLADAAAREAGPDDWVWVHDYHLMLLPRLLRQRRADLRIGFFLHIPVPPPQLLRTLPCREELLAGLLGADLLGAHTAADAAELVRAVEAILGLRPAGCGGLHTVPDRCIRVGAFPIGIDVSAFETLAAEAASEARARALRAQLGSAYATGAGRVALGVDRLDYTKGIVERLLAVERLLLRHPAWRRRFTYVQIAVPSRTGVAEYQALRAEVEEQVARINSTLGDTGWMPVRYLYTSVERDELVAWYRAADLLLVTPRRDGMNLVAKEFVACRVDDTGALVLSEFAGSAAELGCGALLCNPFDVDGTASIISQALCLGPEEKARRMARMRRAVRRSDAQDWARRFVRVLARPGAWHAEPPAPDTPGSPALH